MRGLILVCFIFVGRLALAQVNLVPNGDFESFLKCPYQNDQIRLAAGWTPIDTTTKGADYTSNPNCTAEYLNECATQGRVMVPRNAVGYQYAHSNKGMISLYVYNDVDTGSIFLYRRDYAQSKLRKKLVVGKHYCVSYYVALAETSRWAIKEISTFFDNGSIDSTSFCGIPQTQYIPQITNSSGVITDTINWTKIEGSFVATGKEQFITIGNFKDKAHTTVQEMLYGSYTFTYYYIDDVSVVESDLPADAGPDTHVANDSVYIGRPMSDAIWCDWRVLGSSTIIGQGPGIKVKPKVRTRYVVTQNLCGNITRDTVTVDVWPAGVNNVNGKEQRYVLSPNPVQSVVHVSQSIIDERPVQLTICDAMGREVFVRTLQFTNGQCGVDMPHLPSGFYLVKLKDGWGNGFVMKMTKE